MFKAPSTSDHATQDTQSTAQELRELPIGAVLPNPAQPRRHFDEEALQGLAGSIGECGVLQPVLVRPLQGGEYELLAGERRWRAAKIAGFQSIPALVSRYEDRAALEVGLIENLAREDLNPVEEARACATLVKELGLTVEQVGRRVGRSRVAVSYLIGLLRLSDEILELLERGELSAGHGRVLLRVKELDERLQLARTAIEEEWSVRTLEARARTSNMDLLESQQDRGEQGQDPEQPQDRTEQARDPIEPARDAEQARDLAALNVARAWGDLLGAEVDVRSMRRQLRLEVSFDFAAEGIALAERLATVIARGSKGR
jgi:ParB family transcriptional regulator, chromosome partitioning protein